MMNVVLYNKLLTTGFSKEAVETLFETFQSQDQSLATKEDVHVTELSLQKEIEVVRKEIKEVELSLQKEIEVVRKEIEVVRKEIKEVELRLHKEIEEVRKEIEEVKRDIEKSKSDITLRMMFFFSPIYIALILFLLKQMF